MEVLRVIITIIQVICVLALIVTVMLQTGNNGLSGAIAGSSDSFMSKNKNAGREAALAKMTKYIAAVFMVLTLVLSLI